MNDHGKQENSVELVTLAHATLNRIGSTSFGGFIARKEASRVCEVPDGSLESLRELVLTIAEENGEPRDRLRAMSKENAWSQLGQQGAVAFNIQGPNVSYSDPYAICYAHPALKIGDRYFKLEEVKVGGR